MALVSSASDGGLLSVDVEVWSSVSGTGCGVCGVIDGRAGGNNVTARMVAMMSDR
jgi:hypothetical protein